LRDDINAPLGPPPSEPGAVARLAPWLGRGLVGLLIGGAALGGYQAWRAREDRLAGAVAHIETATPPAPAPAAAPSSAAAAAATATAPDGARPGLSATASARDVEAASGVVVTRNGGAGAPGAMIIDVPQALGVRLPPAPDKRLIEKSRFGLLPRIGPDGARAVDVYARPLVEPVQLKSAPRIALLVGGLGIDAAATRAAIARLPADVSLGFAATGVDLDSAAAAAREAGHEILLQAPMEPMGSAASIGQAMLAASDSADQTRDKLLGMLGRFTGYVGVSNYLGGKFTADRGAFAPVLAELASRGLGYLDDGSSPRSLVRDLAPVARIRSAVADVVIDANPTPEAIEAQLARLEALARKQDGVIGVATALPVSLDHIAHWAATLESRGLALAPVSSLLARPGAAP